MQVNLLRALVSKRAMSVGDREVTYQFMRVFTPHCLSLAARSAVKK